MPHPARGEPHGKSGAASPLKLWPASVKYISSPRNSDRLTPTSLRSLRAPLAQRKQAGLQSVLYNVQSPSPLAQIRAIKDSAHPAFGQFGLFASKHLEPDTLILFYIGYVHDAEDTDETSDYDLSFDRDLGISVDAAKTGNEARFINDYRGVASVPNAEFRDCWIGVGQEQAEKRMGVFVLSAGSVLRSKRARGIAKGEEILVSYGKGFWSTRQQDPETNPKEQI